jgi:hypothetical protein
MPDACDMPAASEPRSSSPLQYAIAFREASNSVQKGERLGRMHLRVIIRVGPNRSEETAHSGLNRAPQRQFVSGQSSRKTIEECGHRSAMRKACSSCEFCRSGCDPSKSTATMIKHAVLSLWVDPQSDQAFLQNLIKARVLIGQIDQSISQSAKTLLRSDKRLAIMYPATASALRAPCGQPA